MADDNAAKQGFNKSAEGERVSSKLPELELDAQKLATLIHGERKRTKAGQGTEFLHFRPFENGSDNPHKIDWKSSARRITHDGEDDWQMRDMEMEVTHLYFIHIDESASMNFKAPADLYPEQPDYTKGEAAEILGFTLANLAIKAGEKFVLLGSGLGLSGNRAGIEKMRLELERRAQTNEENDIPKLPIHRGKPLPKGSHVFMLSDFLCPLSDIAKSISSLHNAGVKGHIIQILDPAEIEFRFKGHIKLKGMEGPGSHTIQQGESAKEEIEERIHKHIHDVEQMVKKIPGWNYSIYITDQPLHEALVPLYGIKTDRLPKPTQNVSGPKPGKD